MPITRAQAGAALLTVAQLPAKFTDTGWAPAVGSFALPSCAKSRTDRSVDERFPPTVLVGRSSKDTTGVAAYAEEIRAYADVQTATSAYDAMRTGETCTNGTIFRTDGTTLAMVKAPPHDLTAALAVDQATEFAAHVPGHFDEQLVITRIGHLVVRFDLLTSLGANVTFLGDPLAVAKSGLAKVERLAA